MEKDIYRLLNEIEMDLNEYEVLGLSSRKKERCKQKILSEVKKMKKKKVNMRLVTAGMAAGFALMIGAVGIAGSVSASNLFGEVFEKLIGAAKGEKDEKEEREILTKIGEQSVPVQSDVKQQEDSVTTVEHDGVTISVTDLYCDGYVLYYTAMLQTENEAMQQADGIGLNAATKEGQMEVKVDQMDAYSMSQPFTKADDGSFVKMEKIDLMGLELGEDKETVMVDWTLADLTGYCEEQWDEQGEYQSTGTLEGTWKLHFPVTVDRSGNETIEIQKEENGILLENAVKTKSGLVVTVSLPNFSGEPYNDSYNDPDIGIKDAQGNFLQWLGQNADYKEDGSARMQIMVLYDGQKDLSFEVTNKNVDGSVIANIPITLP